MKIPGTAVHLLVWIALIVINLFIIRGYSVDVNWGSTIITWLFYLFIFYVNYLLLIPRLLFRRRIVAYVAAALAVFAFSFVAIKYQAMWSVRNNITRISNEMESYGDIRESFERKDRERERFHREIRRRGLDRETPLPPELTFTEQEEEYGRLRREYERSRAFARGFLRSGYDPLSRFNMPYIYTLLFFYMASVAIAYYEKSRKAELRRSEMEKEKITAELAYLKQQINPHFLFNTLNSIYSYTIGASDPAADAIVKLSSILRYMLYETNRDRVPLADEVAVIYDYIDLQKLRITDKTDVSIRIDGDTRPHRIEPMLLIPILENASKFGVDSVEPSFVNIRMDVTGSEFLFAVSNRIVKKPNTDARHSGIGIRNIRRRLELIYGSGGYRLKAEEKNGVFTVTLQLNLDRRENPGN